MAQCFRKINTLKTLFGKNRDVNSLPKVCISTNIRGGASPEKVGWT